MSTKEEPSKNTYVNPTESGAEMARLINQDLLMTDILGLLPGDVTPREGDQVLDVACGPGGWARGVATRYPHTEVVGIDISQTMMDYASAYAQAQQMTNLSFQVMNVTKPWHFADASFDIIHGRFLASFLHENGWKQVLSEMMRVLVPGGTLILTESDSTGISNSLAFERYSYYLYQAMKQNGLSRHPLGHHANVTPYLKSYLRDAGGEYLQIEAFVLDFSTGTKAHDIMIENLKIAFKLMQPYIMRHKITSQDELDSLYPQIVEDWASPDFHALMYLLRVWGKKPSHA